MRPENGNRKSIADVVNTQDLNGKAGMLPKQVNKIGKETPEPVKKDKGVIEIRYDNTFPIISIK